jgi:uncharacterized protein (TIGR03435 family)
MQPSAPGRIRLGARNIQSGDSPAADASVGATFLEALKEQLRLKMDSQTGPVEVIVVDHIEQPSEN